MRRLRSSTVLFLAIALTAALFAAPAPAAFKHPTVGDTFGSDGTAATTIEGVSQLAINQNTERLYGLAASEEKIRGFDVSGPTTHTPLAGGLPITTAGGGGGDPDIAVSNTDGTIWWVSEGGGSLTAYDPSGTILSGFPISGVFGDPCGGATDSAGNMWVGDYGRQKLIQFNVGGASGETISVGATGNPCHIEFDRSTDDAYVANYNGATFHYTASSGYTEHTTVDNENTRGLAFDATSHVLYVAHSSYINAYNESGALLETFGNEGFHGYRGIAVNESTGVVYVAAQNDSRIFTFPGVIVPDVSTGEPLGNDQVSGTIDPAGGGNVTSCEVEYGLDTKYEGGPPVACAPATPYSGVQNITATLPGLEGETTYHYRVVAGNANGTNFGADRTITPHFVNALKTEAPISVTRNCATLRATYQGEGEEVKFQFRYGKTTSYGSFSPATPGTDTGTGLRTVSSPVCGLEPGQTYHYKVAASNSKGESVAGDVQFTTITAVEFLSTDPATNVTPVSATLNGSWQGNNEDTHYFFEWGKTSAYGNLTAGEPGVDAGSSGAPVHVEFDLSGLNPNTTYHYRIVASNAIGKTEADDRAFTTAKSAPLAREFASDVHSESALLNAEINPGGEATAYHFEYGPDDCTATPCTTVPVPDVAIGSGNTYLLRSIRLDGLEPATTYHFRVVATNGIGSGGYDTTFTTFAFTPEYKDRCGNVLARQQTGAGLLLDCRAYELVSAADTGGYDVESNLVPGQHPYAGYPDASDPPRVLYGVHNGAIPGTPGHPTNKGIDPYIATRGSDSWATSYQGVPADNPFAAAPFSSVPSGADSQLDTFAFGAAGGCSPCFGGGYTGIPVRLANGQLVQGMAGALDPGPSATQDGYVAERVSADGTHLVFGSTSKFEEDGNDNGDASIYVRDLGSGETHVVSKEPAGGNLACLQGAGECNAGEGDADGIAELAISADGSRVLVAQKVGTDGKGNRLWHLYMNVDGADHTIDVTPGASTGVHFDGMTSDGFKVFFTARQPLAGTDDNDTSADIFEAALSDSAATLTRISTGSGTGDTDSCAPALSDGGAQAHWNSIGGTPTCDAVAIAGGGGVGGEDGTVFFLSPEQLDGSDGVADQPNLYVARPGDAPQFVATLDPDDDVVRNAIGLAEARRTDDFQVTPDGEFTVFATTVSLSGYANAGHTEVFRYAAGSDGPECVSCNPTNSNAIGDATLAPNGLSISDSGQVFFNSEDPLSLRDSDNVLDVYEWEPAGTGDCSDQTPVYSAESGSCTSLISSGISAFDSKLMGASSDGTDVFFFTHDVLAEQDGNGPITKLYDARVNGGFFAVPPPALCAASDECHGPSSAPPGPPDIKTVAGNPGNASPRKPCPKGKVRRSGKCVKKKKKATKKHKKSQRLHKGSGR
jgi:hypothetical protein